MVLLFLTGVHSIQMIPHGFARDVHGADTAAGQNIFAGSDMDMESSLYVSELVGLVRVR